MLSKVRVLQPENCYLVLKQRIVFFGSNNLRTRQSPLLSQVKVLEVCTDLQFIGGFKKNVTAV